MSKYLKISDGSRESGTDMKSFEELVKGLEESTVVEQFNPRLMHFYVIMDELDEPLPKRLDVRGYKIEEDYYLSAKERRLRRESGKNVTRIGNQATRGKIELPDEIYRNEQLMADLRREGYLIRFDLENGGYIYVVPSSNASHTICSNVGQCNIKSPLIERFALIESQIYAEKCNKKKTQKLVRVMRKDMYAPENDVNTCLKLMSIQAKSYCYVPQTILLDMIKEVRESLGPENVVGWQIDHYLTSIDLTYPSRKDDIASILNDTDDLLVPGMIFRTSDCGESSLYASASIRFSRIQRDGKFHHSNVPFATVSRVHKGEVDTKLFMEDVKKLWDVYVDVPKKLAGLLPVTISDEDVYGVLCGALKLCNYNKRVLIGTKTAHSYAVLLMRELGVNFTESETGRWEDRIKVFPSGGISAYDIAVSLMTFVDRIEWSTRNSKDRNDAEARAEVNRNNALKEDIKERIHMVLSFDFEKYAVNSKGEYIHRRKEDKVVATLRPVQ